MKTNQLKFNSTNKFKPSKYHVPKYQPSTPKLSDDDYDEEPKEMYLGYSEEQQTSSKITVPIDTQIREASFYRHVAQRVTNTTEQDVIHFEIHSPGGAYNGLTALLSAVLRTEAKTVAYLNGECHSAASMLALSCDEVQVSPFANMLCHFQRYGTAGKSSDIKAFVDHTHDTGAEVFRGIYWGFLTEDEISACIEGKELWLNSVDIQTRLDVREELQNKECQECGDTGCVADQSCDVDCDNCDCVEQEVLDTIPIEKAKVWPDVEPAVIDTTLLGSRITDSKKSKKK